MLDCSSSRDPYFAPPNVLEWISICAGILGLGGEGKLMGEMASFLGYTAAVMAISAVFFILSLSLMASV